jgi:hypothetical protein
MDVVSTPETSAESDEALGTPAWRGPETPEDQARIDARYPKPRRWPLAVAGVVFAALLGTWTLWTAIAHSNPPVSAQVLAFEVVSDSEVRVTLHVDRPDPSVRGACTVITQSTNFQQVGEVETTIEPGGDRLQDVTIVVRTIARATSASLQGCHSLP